MASENTRWQGFSKHACFEKPPILLKPCGSPSVHNSANAPLCARHDGEDGEDGEILQHHTQHLLHSNASTWTSIVMTRASSRLACLVVNRERDLP